ncbi:M57 family metalloprotease [Ekhidna sp. To15]|uniref:M57 family metalloprotease n=1 Tax=Ekhidna sp. To15 TaxID=3395267 RepID=UPI003F51B181
MRRLNYALWSVLVMFLAVGFTSCSTEDGPVADEISDEVLAQFDELGFDVSDIQMVNHQNPITGESSKQYLLEGDIMIPSYQMQEMLESTFKLGQLQEQYRTSNLVSNNQTISVIGYTGGSNALDNTMRTALQWAVNNYNALNIGLNFTLAFGTNYQAYDMVVYRVGGGGGGSAGFPSGGNPYKFIQIQSGTSSYGTNTTEHVITHEMGHCLGLRHTDYFNRSLSCGSGGNEGSGGVGAIHIPGTPTGFDANSVMLACFSANEDGEFGPNDVTALNYLY